MSKHFVAQDAPTIHHSRSRFDLSYNNKTSMNVGTLYPIYLQEIYPGDTFSCDTTLVTRLASSFLRPVMGNLMLDVYYFFVPNRIVFPEWENVFGGSAPNAWTQPVEVQAPHSADDFPFTVVQGSVGDYLGLPTQEWDEEAQAWKPLTCPGGINVLPFRAFAKVYDDWFRDENLVSPMLIRTGDWDINESPNGSDWSPGNYMGMPPKVSKFHDIFTSALPGTQKGNVIKVPLGGVAPVTAFGPTHNMGDHIRFWGSNFDFGSNNSAYLSISNTIADGSRSKIFARSNGDVTGDNYINESNLQVDLSDAGIINVTDIRYAFQLQRILERSARTGSRYVEYLLAAFGVSSPDARLQRAEYLGGKRMPLSVQQVAQSTRGEADNDQLGSLGAFSLSNGRCGYQKGFVEHGFVVGVACIRQYHDYSQGIARFWQRHSRFDYYDPALANISEVPVYKSELYGLVNNSNVKPLTDEVFGYQEAWYDLRARTNIVTGDMRPASRTSYDIWHFADYYANAPTLNKQFIEETPDFVDRTIAVKSSSSDQFIVDIYHKQTAIRVLPTYSIPGLIDHH